MYRSKLEQKLCAAYDRSCDASVYLLPTTSGTTNIVYLKVGTIKVINVASKE